MAFMLRSYHSGEKSSFRDEPKMYLPAKNGPKKRNEIACPAGVATETKKATTGAATQVVGTENVFGCKIRHENENILTLFAKKRTKRFPHYGTSHLQYVRYCK